MKKIIKVSTDLKVTVHEFPKGTIREQNVKLYELIGNGCDMIENVMPKRLYEELGHTTVLKTENSECVTMLVDEEGCFKDIEPNLVGCYLYETDKHGHCILGNVLFVGNEYRDDGICFCEIEEETFKRLLKQLIGMALLIKSHDAITEDVR